jgi:hypothetical protein
MAQTKRKRRTKHRGNAAGMVEARGRTGRRPSPEEQKRANRSGGANKRTLRKPTWKSASLKAGTMAIILFVLTQIGFLVKNASVTSGLTVAVIAMLLYTPLAFWTDKWAYTRQQRKLAESGRG